MKRFADLYTRLDRTNRTSEKLEALEDYFRTAAPEDAIWVVYLIAGRKIGRTITSRQMRDLACEASGYPPWLLDECYQLVGDLSETISLLIPFPEPDRPSPPLHEIIEERLRPLGKLSPDKQRELVLRTWRELSSAERFMFHKLISGNFRVGVSRQSMVLALAKVAGVEPAVIAHRLAGNWQPDAIAMRRLLAPLSAAEPADGNLPFPFMLAHALTDPTESLGAIADWHVEWKWDGIRVQLLRRASGTAIWSRGDELISSGFPELIAAGSHLPAGTVIDGEIVAWDANLARPRPFAALQTRINRKNVELSFWPDVEIKLIAFDLLELAGEDLRDQPLATRREKLAALLAATPTHNLIELSRPLELTSWDDLATSMTESRDRSVEGVMIKRHDSKYLAGRPTGPWWKLKVQPYTVDAVLIAAQPGTGRRAGLLTDYTFGVWNDAGTELVPVAKAYSGLSDREISEMDRFIRSHTTGRFGPVHAVEPLRVFELGFEAIQQSTRHKSGIAVRFPRILRMRTDKQPRDADTLATLQKLLAACGGAA